VASRKQGLTDVKSKLRFREERKINCKPQLKRKKGFCSDDTRESTSDLKERRYIITRNKEANHLSLEMQAIIPVLVGDKEDEGN